MMDKKGLTAEDVKRFLLKSYYDIETGRVSPTSGYKSISVLNALLKAIEVTDLENRYKAIESLLKDK